MSTPEPFDVVDLIRTKRDRGELSTEEISWLASRYASGVVADEQMAAMAMAIFLNGMSRREIRDLTMAMIDTGSRMDFSSLGVPTVDKHSTGGVGDKITLPLMPLVASFGVAVPQLSGRGLGHTGGTLDKLESIPGWRADLDGEEMLRIMREIGGVVCAAGPNLAPADKKLYALRDVTGTVDCVPLIASSIMSKKIAEGTDALVLDVKFGSGSFMGAIERSRELAEVMVALGEDAGVRTSALLTNMEVPLGLAIGNANEVRESVEVLAGGGPADIRELTVEIAREMLRLSGQPDADVEAHLDGGQAMDVWRRWVAAQDGDPDAALPEPAESMPVTADRDGVLVEQQALPFGIAAWRLGAGRARKEDPVVHAAGIDLAVKPGDAVKKGDVLFTLHANDPARFERALQSLEGAYRIGDEGDEIQNGGPLIAGRVTA